MEKMDGGEEFSGWIWTLDRIRGRGVVTAEDGRNYVFTSTSVLDDDFAGLCEQDDVSFTVETSGAIAEIRKTTRRTKRNV